MNDTIIISAKLERVNMLKAMMEILASQEHGQAGGKQEVIKNWSTIESYSAQITVLGTFDLLTWDNEVERQNIIPFKSPFLFSCINANDGSFTLEWSASLS